jgi:hypothetical protein
MQEAVDMLFLSKLVSAERLCWPRRPSHLRMTIKSEVCSS